MIRQLRRLTHTVARAHAPAIAVYAEARDSNRLELRVAAEQGFEGVACVDDAARAALLYCDAWREHGDGWARNAARGLLRFLLYMQEEDGGFVNFVEDWDGQKNLHGPSSVPTGRPWTDRAMHALARGSATFGAGDYEAAFRRGLPWLDRPTPYLDVRAVAVLAALDWWAATGASEVAERAVAWAEEIAASRLGDLLPDLRDEPRVHLWGHPQEVALARAGRAFDRPDLVRIARASAETIWVPQVARAFEAPTTLPFSVSCGVLALSAVADATHESRYAEHAELARDWFRGRNAAGLPIYDRRRGLVYDGIDDGQINRNSGAESNIEGALALFDSLPWEVYRRGRPAPLPIVERVEASP